MNITDFMAALDEAVYPGLRRNRRRIRSRWANGFIKVLARVCAFVRAIPLVWQRIYRCFIPRRHAHQHLACGCCGRIPGHLKHRRRHHPRPKPGGKQKKIIRIDDSDLMRVDMSII